MAILRSVEGKFYEVPDKELSKLEVPADKVKDIIGNEGNPGAPGPQAGPSEGVDPYWCWRNWRNCYCWRNCY